MWPFPWRLVAIPALVASLSCSLQFILWQKPEVVRRAIEELLVKP